MTSSPPPSRKELKLSRAPAPTAETNDELERRTQILDAALACFTHLGIARTSVQDVARMAKVSRGTVYRYFEERQILIDSAVEHGAQRYYADAAAAMRRKTTLAQQIGAMAEVVTRTQIAQQTRNRVQAHDDELMRHIVADSDATIRRTTQFLVPYVEAARERGEVARNLDVEAASEWLARAIKSFSSVHSSAVFDVNKPRAVGRFVERFAVAGLR